MTPELQEQALDAMREAAKGKPGHLAYIEACVAWQKAGGKDAEMPTDDEFDGLHWHYAADIAADVERIFTVEKPGWHYAAPRLYIERRARARSAAGKRRQTIEHPAATSAVSALMERMPFLNGGS